MKYVQDGKDFIDCPITYGSVEVRWKEEVCLLVG